MTTEVFVPVKILRHFPLKAIVFIRTILLLVGIGAMIGYGASFVYADLPVVELRALTFVLLPIAITIMFFEIYLRFGVMDPPVAVTAPTNERFDFYTRRVLYRAWAMHPRGSITMTDITVALLEDPHTRILWHRLGIDPKVVDDYFIGFRDATDVMATENIEARVEELLAAIQGEHRTDKIYIGDLLLLVFDQDTNMQTFLLQHDITYQDVDAIATWYEAKHAYRKSQRFWTLEHQLRRRPIGLSWAYGYTPVLSRFSHDISAMFERVSRKLWLVGRQEALDQTERVVARDGQNNVLYVGPAGVGKRTLVYGMAQRIANGASLPALSNKRILELDVTSLMSRSKGSDELETWLQAVLSDASSSGNIMLYIDDFQNYIGMTQRDTGTLDIATTLLSFIEQHPLQVIAAIDEQGYHYIVEHRPDILKLFERIDITPSTQKETLRILQTMVPGIEHKEKIFITYQALKTIVQKSDELLFDVPFPEKAIDLLSEVVVDITTRKKKILEQVDVERVLSQKTHVPLGALQEGEKDKIAHLDELLHQDIVNQQVAIDQLTRTIVRLRAGITNTNKPAGSFLFVGPTGVGKTLTARTLAKVYFGSEASMIRFDMSEYQSEDALDRFLGSTQTNEHSHFLAAVHDHPYAVLLLDEFEKASPQIHHLFLQMLDEGMLTDAFGKQASLKQHIIIATSNAGSEHIRQLISQNIDPAQQKESTIAYILQQNLFRPELLNRFDDVVVFHPLVDKHVHEVAQKMLERLVARLKKQNYELTITAELISYVARKGYDPQFGARAMRRVIQDTIEVVIAQQIIDGTLQKGVAFTVDVNQLR